MSEFIQQILIKYLWIWDTMLGIQNTMITPHPQTIQNLIGEIDT